LCLTAALRLNLYGDADASYDGSIGMEFGYVMNSYGVDVTIIESLPRARPTRTPRF
jgi:hypothetical protein